VSGDEVVQISEQVRNPDGEHGPWVEPSVQAFWRRPKSVV
jgi:hypothetical protein